MARDFDSTSNQYLTVANGIVTGPPFTMACWFRQDSVSDGVLVSVIDAGGNNFSRLKLNRNKLNLRTKGTGGAAIAKTTTNYSTNTWHHAIGSEISSSSRKVWLDAGSMGSKTKTITLPSLAECNVGRLKGSSNNYTGALAEIGIWDVELTADERAALALGVLPIQVRPMNLLEYWPLWGIHSSEPSVFQGGHTLTNSGTTRADEGPPVRSQLLRVS